MLNIPALFRNLLPGVLAAGLLLSASSATATERTGSVEDAPQAQQGQGGRLEQEGSQNALDLVLKSIRLSQGEGGSELWRLKAEWANVQKQDDMILLTKPRLTYFMKEDGKIMHVRSDTGNVDQKKQILRFIDNVHVTQDDKILTGKLLVYDGTPKTMTMPEGAALIASGVEGSCNHLVWHINERRIETMGDILMHLNSAAPDQNYVPPALETLSLDSDIESRQEKNPGGQK